MPAPMLHSAHLMKHLIIALMMASLCATAADAAPPKPSLKLFILTGQSNSLGTTNGDADPSPGADPADAQVPCQERECGAQR